MGLDVYLEMKVDTGGEEPHFFPLHDFYVTYNLSEMYREAGIWDVIYDCEGKTSSDIKDAVRKGYDAMMKDPSRFRKYDSPNGWGIYDDTIEHLRKFVEALEKNPKGSLRTWQ